MTKSPRQHSPAKVAAFVRLLRRTGASDKLIKDFEEIVLIDNGIAEERGDLEALDRLLLDVCRRHGFSKVFDKPGERAWLRPTTIGWDHPDYHEDCPSDPERFNPIAEQAYRRGYDQGFASAQDLIKHGENLATRETELRKWRRAPVFFGPSYPGDVEAWGIKVTVRSGLSAKVRFDVLERDGRRCVVCGRSASDGVVLHVDHVVSIRNGGSNDATNLQTLCEECNLGKGCR